MSSAAPHTDQLSTGLIRVGADHGIVWANASARAQLALGSTSLLNQTITSFIPELSSKLSKTQSGFSIQISEVYLPKSGLAVDVIVADLGDGSLLCELFPITERIRQRQTADRADRQQHVSLMARGLAHEIRNPLAGVKAGAQLIARQSQDSAIARHADMIERGVDRITAMLERFADDQGHQKTPLNLHQLIQESTELVLAESHGALAIDTDFDPSIPTILADQEQLNQLFLNLLRNSAQAKASKIKITTRIEHSSPIVEPPVKHAIKVVIADDGIGVPSELHHRLFLPMVTGKTTGSGFGLAIAQQIARAHDGLIEHQPQDKGAAFIFRLPLVTQPEREADYDSQ